jgi:hypothetical protein
VSTVDSERYPTTTLFLMWLARPEGKRARFLAHQLAAVERRLGVPVVEYL